MANGILDWFSNPANQGLLNLSAGLLQAGGPSPTPVSFGQALGQGMQQGLRGMQNAQYSQLQQGFLGAKQAEMKKQQEMEASRAAAMARLGQDPRFAGLQDLLQVAPEAAIGQAFPKPMKADVSPLSRLMAERDALPPEHPNRALYDDAIKKATTSTPLVTVQPDSLGLKPKDRFDMEDKLRGDFQAHPTVKAADELRSAFNLIETAYQRPSAANDLAMATKYMKILDPTSVVRESEFALAVNATGLMDKVQNYAASVLEGKKLNPTQRKDFYDSAKAINEAFQKEREGVATRFSSNAKQYNLNPENVIGAPRTSAPAAPKIKRYNPKTGKIE